MQPFAFITWLDSMCGGNICVKSYDSRTRKYLGACASEKTLSCALLTFDTISSQRYFNIINSGLANFLSELKSRGSVCVSNRQTWSTHQLLRILNTLTVDSVDKNNGVSRTIQAAKIITSTVTNPPIMTIRRLSLITCWCKSNEPFYGTLQQVRNAVEAVLV